MCFRSWCCAAGVLALLLPRIFVTRLAACWLAAIAVSGCSTSNVVGPKIDVQSKIASGQPAPSLDSFAYDVGPPPGILLPSASSQAVGVTERGDGQMIGEAGPSQKSPGYDGGVVLNLSSVPLQQAAKTVLGDMIGVNYVVDPRVDGVVSVQTTKPVTKADALELFQAALTPIGAVLVQNRGIYRIVPADQAATGAVATGRMSGTGRSRGEMAIASSS